MSDQDKVPYLKVDRGRYFYQRRVPQRLQAHLGIRRWQIPCGDVTYSKAVQKVVTWAEEHDELIANLRDPDRLREAGVKASRQRIATRNSEPDPLLPNFYAMTEQREGEKQFYTRENLPRPWQAAAVMMMEAQKTYNGQPSLEGPIWEINYRIEEFERGDQIASKLSLPNLPGLKDYVAKLDAKTVAAARIEVRDTIPMPLYADLYLDKLKEAHDIGFGADAITPTDPDEREEYDFIKRKLERRISELSPDPNTLTALMERYCDFNSIRPGPRSKYRRDLSRLVAITGDVPIGHVRVESLRELRDDLIGQIKPSSIQAVFTPIKGVFAFAFDEGIIEMNPMQGVKLPRDKRPIEERKWKPFDPLEFTRIMKAADELWSSPVQGLSDPRREAIHMVVRVLAFSGMRPIEVIRLTPDDVTKDWIRITGSKTESSTRVVPLHPEISDFPNWIASGGLNTFQSIKTDQVGSVRHNFGRLLRDKMEEPISDPQKALYSLRSTFVNAMRRAGADIQVQRAILGHKEAGAIRHYLDGPEFAVKRKWVDATDPRR
eukprot:CAMPEP_0184440874 /NCGR_PEP_ID=MMETSP0738-20130409/755792_1 /TAXON_ID=385413 /ORGANISM="Thalassiosira miniscula, Strain CCMP1093" /LENGTH=546 /DNA_ID=CAMNT_0026808789 /DNA_START=229 /DNA_END=1869 /DNA_ORIENTATION=+